MKFVICSVFSLLYLSAASANFKLTSKVLKPNGTMENTQVFNSFGCTGENISPDLTWTGAPKETKSFALTVYDPDAPTGSGWWHWTVLNIPASVTSLETGASGSKMPTGSIEGRTDYGKPGYGGACPPAGDKPHRYIFKVYALKDSIPLDKEASAAMVGFYINQLKISEASLQVKYGRKK